MPARAGRDVRVRDMGRKQADAVPARDRLGVKPLYYAEIPGMLLFASEIKAILAHPAISRDIDLEALYHYVTFRIAPAPMTMFAGIKKLPAGCYLTCDRNGKTSVATYWNAFGTGELSRDLPDEGEVVGRIGELLAQSVAKRSIADVPTGVFLSGGLDSSAVVGLLAPRVNTPVNTFSIGIGDLEEQNELEYARQIATQFRTNHREILIGQGTGRLLTPACSSSRRATGRSSLRPTLLPVKAGS